MCEICYYELCMEEEGSITSTHTIPLHTQLIVLQNEIPFHAQQLDKSGVPITIDSILTLLEHYATSRINLDDREIMIIRLYSAMLMLINTALEKGDSQESCDKLIEAVDNKLFDNGYRVIVKFDIIYD